MKPSPLADSIEHLNDLQLKMGTALSVITTSKERVKNLEEDLQKEKTLLKEK
jgi:hypothetical protein